MLRSWVANFREYNINAVFPLRESLQPGDIFVVVSNVDPGPGVPPQAIHIDSLNLSRAWTGFAAGRMELPADRRLLQAGEVFSQPDGSAQTRPLPAAAPASVNRPRLAAFPDLEIARTTAASLGIGATGNPILAALGLSSSNEISVKVAKVEHVALPVAWVYPELNAWFRSVERPDPSYPVAFQALCIGAEAMQAVLRGRGISGPQAADAVRVGVVTEVFAAREVSYTALDQVAGSATASAILDSTAELSRLVGTTPAPAQGAASTGAIDPALQARLQAEVDRIRREVAGFNGGGGSFSIVSAAGQRVALVQRFERPLVFGWRGVLFAMPTTDSQAPICDSPLRPWTFGADVAATGSSIADALSEQPRTPTRVQRAPNNPVRPPPVEELGTNTLLRVKPDGVQ